VNVDGSFVAVEVVAPNALEQRVAREGNTGIRRKGQQERVLARFEPDIVAVDTRFPGGLVDLQAAETPQLRTRLVLHAAAPQNRSHARDDFARGERLHDVIVGPQFEADDAIDFVGTRGNHDHPIEYQHRWLRSVVTQYEVGRDVANFADGVRGALRADPDVLFIGELRGVETVTACLQAAETGHVVFAALHTPSETPQAINRIIGLFPSDEQENARVRLADSLRALVGLRLIPLADQSGLRAAAEIMIASEAVRRLIRDGATHQLRGVIASGRKEGMQTLESHVAELVSAGDIDLAAARAASLYPDEIKELSGTGGYRRR